jgi:hypothetical protein
MDKHELNESDGGTLGRLDRAERDEMRRLNPEIDELLYERSHEADNATYNKLGDKDHQVHGAYMDELQDRISEIVGEENYEAFWDDWEDDDFQEATILVKWREFKLALLRPCRASESAASDPPEFSGLTLYNCFQELMERHEWPDWPTLKYASRRMEEWHKRQCAARPKAG